MTEIDGPELEVRGTLDGRVIHLEITVHAPTEAVWAALTEPARLAAWYGQVEGDLRAGGGYHARLLPSGWEGDGRIRSCEPGRRFTMESSEPGDPPTSDELDLFAAEGGGTRIVLTRERPSAEMIALYAVGTQLHLENLAAHLAGRGPLDPDPFWAALRPRYEALAGD